MDFKNFYKYLINFLSGLTLICLSIISKYAHAKDLSDLSPLGKTSAGLINKNIVVGADYLYNFNKAKGDWQRLLRDKQPGANLYLGYNWQYIMLEIGYTWTTRKSKECILDRGKLLFNTNNDNATILNGQIRFRSTNFNLNLFASFTGDLDIITSIGFALARPHLTVHSSNANSNFGYQLTQIEAKTIFVPRVGLGLRYLLSESFGLRAMWRFEKNSKITFRQYPSYASNKPFRDGMMVAFGFFTRI